MSKFVTIPRAAFRSRGPAENLVALITPYDPREYTDNLEVEWQEIIPGSTWRGRLVVDGETIVDLFRTE